MGSSAQGVRSSRTDRITQKHRNRLRFLDRKIAKTLRLTRFIGTRNGIEVIKRRVKELDAERKALRLWMKSTGDSTSASSKGVSK